ncbi:MAG: hypothetical protein R3Y67_09280 [Eubacteriales bacterium]
MDIRGDLTKADVMRRIDQVKPDIVCMMHWPHDILNAPKVSDINPYT